MILPSLAYAQEQIVFEQRDPQSTYVKRVVFLGEGWRNLRLLRFDRLIDNEVVTSSSGYYFCGERSIVHLSEVENLRSNDTREVSGIAIDDELFTPGYLVNAQEGVPGFVDEDQVAQFIRALSSPCAGSPQRLRDPEWLFLANTDEDVIHLVPGRFIRSDGSVRYWRETRHIRAAKVTVRSVDRSLAEYDADINAWVIAPELGSLMVQEEASCSAGTLRQIQAIAYDRHGDVVRSTSPEQSTAREVIPNSVGESVFQIVCLIH
jgi:hypothetical protein